MAINIQLRRGTAAQWTSSNPTLMEGELGVETDTGKYKIGNGAASWANLSYGGLEGQITLENLPENPTEGYALIYNGTSLAWGQAGSPADDADGIIGTQVFS